MRIFKLDDNFSVVCENYSTRNSWGHTAVILLNGVAHLEVKSVGVQVTIKDYDNKIDHDTDEIQQEYSQEIFDESEEWG